MLKRYAFSFYEVVGRIERLRQRASVFANHGPSGPLKLHEHEIEDLQTTLNDMRSECETLDLIATANLITHVELSNDRGN
jgi:hypothetical protein